MKSNRYWPRLLSLSLLSATLVIPCRFLVVNAFVDVQGENPHVSESAVQKSQDEETDGIYDGVLMKMSDLAYANLDAYKNDTLETLESLSLHHQGPSGIYKQVQYVDTHDWHLTFSDANKYFFSDLQNWKIIATDSQYSDVGFYAVAYQQGNQIVIAFRGTDGVSDLVSDAGIYLQISTLIDQLTPAQKFVEQVRSALPKGTYQVVFTGHSLGAWLAQQMYATYDNKYTGWDIEGATVFDSIGTHFQPNIADVTRVKDYRFQGDVFSHYGSSLGAEIDIPDPTPNASIYNKHQMFDFYPHFYGRPSSGLNLGSK